MSALDYFGGEAFHLSGHGFDSQYGLLISSVYYGFLPQEKLARRVKFNTE